jgi:hypothetical protein
VLCGVRDLRDYRIHSEAEQEIITGGSAFNIKAKSLRLGDFNAADCTALLASTPPRPAKPSPTRPSTGSGS